jgi:uncharacterized protein (DUF4415 family)
MVMNSAKCKPWGKSPPAMLHVNMRLPKEVVDFYRKEYPEYTKAMREVLVKFAKRNDKT